MKKIIHCLLTLLFLFDFQSGAGGALRLDPRFRV
jgi:hypothetical protein